VVALCGDGGFQMVVQTLSSHALQSTRATIIVLDNGTYGLEQAFMGTGLKAYEPTANGYAAPITGYNVIPRWDYVAIAAAMGMAGEKAETVGAFQAAMLRARSRHAPTLIQAVLSERDMPQRIKDLAQSFR
jgi:indolepyruvate decarboxylase